MPNSKGTLISVVTGSRADYGLLYPVMRAIQADGALALQVIATGMHLAPAFGTTSTVIEQDGFAIDAKVEMLLSGDTPTAVTKSLGLGIVGMADVLERLRPDLMLVLGDRFEILAAAAAATIARIPIAHIGGGDTTLGAFDESIRHSITKMAHLHFVTNAASAARVVQMGEDPTHVFHVGSPGIDCIRMTRLFDRNELRSRLGIDFRRRNLLITFHPVTLEEDCGLKQFEQLMQALDRLGGEFGLIFTRPNADPAGLKLIKRLDQFVAGHDNARAYASLGQEGYLSVMAQADAVVGNSSSGFYEAPTFKRPFVNVGERQEGRIAAASVLTCRPIAEEIYSTIQSALSLDCTHAVNPYGDGHATERMMAVLRRGWNREELLKKRFHEVKCG